MFLLHADKNYLAIKNAIDVVVELEFCSSVQKEAYVHTYTCVGFPHSSVVKESDCNAGDLGLIPELGRSPGEGNRNPLQYSCLENPMDREEPGRLQSMGSQESDKTEQLSMHLYICYCFTYICIYIYMVIVLFICRVHHVKCQAG